MAPLHKAGPKSDPVQLLVDTGSAVTIIPKTVVTRLDLKGRGRLRLTLANGRTMMRPYADLYLCFKADGRRERIPARVILGEKSDATVLGVPVLETAGYSVDPVSKKLVKVGHLVA